MAQRQPPSLTASGPLGFQFLALGPGLHQVPATVTSEVLRTCGQLEKCLTGCESPPGYVERLQEGQGADTSCLATLIAGGILQRPLGSTLGMAPGEEEWIGFLTISGKPAAHTLSLLGLFSGLTTSVSPHPGTLCSLPGPLSSPCYFWLPACLPGFRCPDWGGFERA